MEKLENTHDKLNEMLWLDKELDHLFSMAKFSVGRQTKYLDKTDISYITDGLNHEGRFRNAWEGRAEFMWRFLDTLIMRGEARLLFSAAVEASRLGVEPRCDLSLAASKSLSEWIDEDYKKQIEELRG